MGRITQNNSWDSSPYAFRVVVVTPPVTYPVSLEELKAQLRITHTDEDAYLTTMIKVATEMVETYLGRKLLTTELKQVLDFSPSRTPWWDGVVEGPNFFVTAIPAVYELQWLPLQEVTEIATYSRSDVRTVYPAANYRVDAVDKDLWGRVALKEGKTWPTDLRNLVAHETLYTAGYGDDADDVPFAIRQGVLMTAAYFYTNRGDCPGDACACIAAAGVAPTLHMFRVKKI